MELIDICLRHWPTLAQHGAGILVLIAVWASRKDLATRVAQESRSQLRLAKLMRLHADRHPETSRWLFDDDDHEDPPASPVVK